MLFYHVDDVLRATVCCVTADFQQFSFGHNDVIHHCGNFGLSVLTNQTIFDGRNIYDKDEMKNNHFDYFCIGVDTSREVLKLES